METLILAVVALGALCCMLAGDRAMELLSNLL